MEVLSALQRGKMIYAITIGLTLLSSWAIIKVIAKARYKNFKKTLYRQSDLHMIMKKFFAYPTEEIQKPLTQLEKRRDKDKIKVLVIDEDAYWVSDNMFFIAKTEDGEVLLETAEQINTDNMSKQEINKMLFILDNLQNGRIDDSGSTRNERF